MLDTGDLIGHFDGTRNLIGQKKKGEKKSRDVTNMEMCVVPLYPSVGMVSPDVLFLAAN